MSPEIAQLHAKLDMVLNMLESQKVKPAPSLRVGAFAKEAGVSRWTIQDRIRAGVIEKKNGRIPRQYLSLFVS